MTALRIRPALAVLSLLALVASVLVLAGRSAAPLDALEPGTGLPVVPRTDTPRVIGGTVTDQTVVGDRVIVVGTFEQVRDNDGTLLNRPYLMAYDIDTGAIDRSYDPAFDREVLSIEPDGVGGVVVGGKFQSIDGSPQLRLGRLDADGNHVAAFRAEAGAKVTAIAVRNNRVYVGGPFSAVRARGTWAVRDTIAAFHLTDGALDTAFDFPIREAAGRGGDLSVKSLAFAGDDLVIAHNGLTVAGQSRVGAAIIDTTPVNSPTLRNWRTDFFKRTTTDAGTELAITDMAVSPDGSYFVIVSSGGDRPLMGRDAAVRFETAGGAGVEPTWISRHFDSLFGVGISDKAVFIGGHFQFQEAPGSPDPYPGDPNVNYGAGAAGEGAAQLGNQVVPRQQIGGLDPATGKSLNWNPGADAEIGVESLVVVDRGLLVGQDGDTLGDKDIGRHGFFDITRDVAPEIGLSTSITSHFSGENVDAGTFVLSGNATDGDAGVKRVQLAIFEIATVRYVQPDGSLGGWVGLPTTLDSPGATETGWSSEITINEPGIYRVQAKTFTEDGRKDKVAAYVDLTVRAADDALPSVSIDTTTVEPGRVLVVTGRATDDRGVRRVMVGVRDPETNEYLQPDGSLVADQSRSYEATLAAVDAPETSWSHTFVLPRDGRFRVEANVFDTAGQDDEKFFYRTVTVAENDVPPVIDLGGVTVFESPANERFTITPTIVEDVALDQVRIRIRKQLTNEGTRPDGSYGTNGTWITLPNIEGAQTISPTWTSPVLPAGTHLLQIQATDQVGQTTTSTTRISVGPIGDANPDTRITNRVGYESPQTIEITGTVTDDVAVERVEIFIRDQLNLRWVSPDGSRTTTPVAHLATVDTPGATSSAWNFSWTADQQARYTVYAIGVDNAGQDTISYWRTIGNYWWTPGDTMPDPGVISPLDGDTVNGGRLFVTGRATDDNEINVVQLRVRRLADNKFLRVDGTYGSGQWHKALLSNPDRPGTNWDWSSPDLEPGDYRIEVRARDDSLRWTTTTMFVTVAP